MKWFKDGDQVVVTKDDFVDLQESPAVFIPAASEAGQAIQRNGILGLALGDLAQVQELLKAGGGTLAARSRSRY